MRRSGRIVRQVLDAAAALVRPGVTTMDLERVAEEIIRQAAAKAAFKGYYDYPCVLCTSLNNEIVHGIPSEKRVLQQGDIVSIDTGVVLDGYYADAAVTVTARSGIGDTVVFGDEDSGVGADRFRSLPPSGESASGSGRRSEVPRPRRSRRRGWGPPHRVTPARRVSKGRASRLRW